MGIAPIPTLTRSALLPLGYLPRCKADALGVLCKLDALRGVRVAELE